MKIRQTPKRPINRAALYAAAFPQYPDSHFKVSDRWISATWITGNNYKSKRKRRKSKLFYGAYFPSYIPKIYSMFPDAKKILHLFSGSLTKKDVAHPFATVMRMDKNPKLKPDIVGDAEVVGGWDSGYDLILADPPYSIQDAENYGFCLCNKRKVLAACHERLNPGGTLCWMDQSIPMYTKLDWHWYGVISVYRSTNHRIRGIMLFQKQ